MYYYLKQHPDVFMPAGRWEEKEPSFFCDLTPPWAIQYQRFDNYMGLFAGAREEKVIENGSMLCASTLEHRQHCSVDPLVDAATGNYAVATPCLP